MIVLPNFDPVAIHLGPVSIHWYGLMYLLGFLCVWWLGTIRSRRSNSPLSAADLSDLIFYGALGVVLGGRIGYVLLYNLPFYLQHPLSVLKVWDGGMSFHGGFVGVLVTMWWFGRKQGAGFWRIMDFLAPLVGPGFFFVRIANFINQELWGRPTDMPWGVVFPRLGDGVARHPSQLYEALLEGLVLFLVLWVYSAKPRPTSRVSALFLILYGSFRFFVEFFREPDRQVGFIAFNWLTEGMLLSLPMVLFGVVLFLWSGRRSSRSSVAK